ncbi:MAG: hypothetical protein Q9O62_07505 [Ardenticatenia bacterium]|nr:hypothetical protein [Ardenticatenia bacterium]
MAPQLDVVVHATHEAGFKVGGIGAVLHHLLADSGYVQAVGRTVLVGPFDAHDPTARERLLASHNGLRIRYSAVDGVVDVDAELARAFERIELYYHVHLLYGTRRFGPFEHEVVLVDPREIVPNVVERFKYHLWEHFGVQSDRYEHDPEYEQHVRVAEPALVAVQALIGSGEHPRPPAMRPPDPEKRVLFIAHEWLGLPPLFCAVMRAPGAYRTAFYAHEVATARRLVENHPGHDTRFYNAMQRARARGLYVEDVFGDQSAFFKHALLKAAGALDLFLGVGDLVIDELRFLSPSFARRPVHLVYNGVPDEAVDLAQKRISKARLQAYAENLFGFRPTWVFSHVARLVPSKGLWRDVKVMAHLDRLLAERRESAVLFTLSSALPAGRRAEDVRRWEADYGWPVNHRADNGDLVGPEVAYYQMVQQYNHVARATRIVLVNQFGWSAERCGRRMPAEMRFEDLRWGTDLEFGQSAYEPFGIAQVEPLAAGALCCLSNVCGCVGFLRRAGGENAANVLVTDYVSLPPEVPGREPPRRVGHRAGGTGTGGGQNSTGHSGRDRLAFAPQCPGAHPPSGQRPIPCPAHGLGHCGARTTVAGVGRGGAVGVALMVEGPGLLREMPRHV